MKSSTKRLEAILARATDGQSLGRKDLIFLLEIDDQDQQEIIFRVARNLRHKFFGDRIFLYGFLYITTYCKNDCRFCFFRKSNRASRRYRKDDQEIVSVAGRMAESGVHLIDMTMGEDPAYFNRGMNGFEKLLHLVTSVGQTTGLPVMISPGVMHVDQLKKVFEAGASWYACYQETHCRSLFQNLRHGQDYDVRMAAKLAAHQQGLLIEEGLLCGVGERSADVAESISVMRLIEADQVRVMNFIPQQGTPMENRTPPDLTKELLISAVMRLSFPDKLIPASLDVDGLVGLRRRLDAGANVVTSLVPPGGGLAGVARHSLDIEDGNRTTASVLRILERIALCPASEKEYIAWIQRRKRSLEQSRSKEKIAC
ncbi:MAG: methylornithine synthase PylB [Desulfobacterales bacterium]